eukprot:6388553-Alexandrium_andersonii.AAC.1
MSVSGERVEPEDNTDDVDEEMSYLESILGCPLEDSEERPEAGASSVRGRGDTGRSPSFGV